MNPTHSAHQRSARNYLLDPAFQLKYTAFLVGATCVVSAGLGALLWTTNDSLVDQARVATEQSALTVSKGQSTVDRGKEVLAQSNKVNQVVASTIETCYGDNPQLLAAFRAEAAKDDQRLKVEQSRLEQDTIALGTRARDLARDSLAIETRLRSTRVVLIVTLLVLVLFMGGAGIILTHRVAGPIHKMKRLLAGVGEGHLSVREKLRKGDELVHFFDAFEQMVGRLRSHRKAELEQLDAILDLARKTQVEPAVEDSIRRLRDRVAEQLHEDETQPSPTT